MSVETQVVAVRQSDELTRVIRNTGVSAETVESLKSAFVPIAIEAEAAISEARSIVINGEPKVSEAKAAAGARRRLKDARLTCERTRKSIKEDSLRKTKAIDGVAGYIAAQIEPEESRMQEIEDYEARQIEARKAKFKRDREAALQPYIADLSFYQLGEMPQSAFDQLLESSKTAHEARIAAAAKAEADRLAKEKADRQERARIAAENARLKAEADARELAAKAERDRAAKELAAAQAKAKREREAVEAKAREERRAAEAKAQREREAAAEALRQEREARAKLEAAAQAKADAEAKRIAAEQEAVRKAAAAPDNAKILAVAAVVRAVVVPPIDRKRNGQWLHDTISDIIDGAADQIELLAKE